MLLSTIALCLTPVPVDLELPAILGDGVVLPREGSANLWGWASPGATITVRASWGAEATATVAENGRFDLSLETTAAAQAQTLTFSGDGEVTVSDVSLGEVWLASGQSNMAMALGSRTFGGIIGHEAELAAADRDDVRLFTVGDSSPIEPARDVRGNWAAATRDGAFDFSAVGWVFASGLATELGCTVGIVDSTWGGTPIEAWMSERAIRADGDFAGNLAIVDRERANPGAYEREVMELRDDWLATVDAGDAGLSDGYAAADFDDSGWGQVTVPGRLSSAPFADADGVFWLRTHFELGAGAARLEDATLELGPIDDMDRVFINGTAVGGLELPGVWNFARTYTLEPGVLREGRNSLAVRVIDTGGAAGLTGDPDELRLVVPDGPPVPLGGVWRAAVGSASVPALPGFNRFGPRDATALYNGMIAPLSPFSFDGVLWYQGEANRLRYGQYARLFPAQIEDWRRTFQAPELPFYFAQIAPFGYPGDIGEVARLREAQTAALALPATGMAVTLDIGDCADIHSKNKRPIGRRMLGMALNDLYGRNEPGWHSPQLVETHVEPGALRLTFDAPLAVVQEFAVRPGADADWLPVAGLEVAGEDRVFHPGRIAQQGALEGLGEYELRVSSAAVAEPVAARYAFSTCPTASIELSIEPGQDVVPLAPFRTDDWPIQPPELWGAFANLEFEPLFDGQTLDGWVNVNGAQGTWEVRDGNLHSGGDPVSVLRSAKPYRHFILELEWRHLRAGGNSGLFIWSDALPQADSPFPRGIEVQVMDGPEGSWYTTQGDVFPVGPATLVPDNGRGGARAFPTAMRSQPSPGWNHYRVIAVDGAIELFVNGAVVTTASGASPSFGFLHLEAEGSPIEFRRIRIADLDPQPVAPWWQFGETGHLPQNEWPAGPPERAPGDAPAGDN